MSVQGTVPVVAALVGNLLVTLAKGIASAFSGSSAMYAETIHSFADTLNQALLLVGIQRSQKKADRAFGYGYGRERFFWALISACGIFFVGAGVTIYRGFESLARPESVEANWIVAAVLAISFIIESSTLATALKDLAKRYPTLSWKDRLHAADTSTLAVCLEDFVAVLGVAVAAISIGASYLTGNSLWDALGSILIGVLLGAVAVILVYRNWGFLMGRAISADIQDEIIEELERDPAVERVIDFKSSVLDAGVYRVKCEIEFNGAALMRGKFESEYLHERFEEVRGDYEDFLRFCAEYADRIPRLMGKRIDDIELKLRKRFPSVRHIDIEIN